MVRMQGTGQAKSLSQKILAVLAESSLPVTTHDLIALVATGLSHSRQRVWTQLRRLHDSGLVECQTGRRTGDAPDAIGRVFRHRAVTRWRLAR